MADDGVKLVKPGQNMKVHKVSLMMLVFPEIQLVLRKSA